VFLAVVSSLFALFMSAYFMRMQVADWAQMPAPKVLWFNTGVLILSSVALQYAQVAARRGRMEAVGDGLIAGGLFACTFLVGQLCMATAQRRRLLLGDQPSQRLLLSVHRPARTALVGRPRGLGPDGRQGVARR